MKIFYKLSKYEQWIDLETENWNCTCPDFIFRQSNKEKLGMCKHVKELLERMDKQIIKWLKN